jgi:hypothetical protein
MTGVYFLIERPTGATVRRMKMAVGMKPEEEQPTGAAPPRES